MKILFLAHRTPYPPNKGEKIRAYHLLSHLAKSHAVTLVYWVDDPRDLCHTPLLRSLCRGPVIPVWLNRTLALSRAVRSLLRGRSFTEGFYGSRLYQHAVDDALRNGPFDAIYIFSSAVASYAKNVDAKSKIVDFVDVDSDKWGQLAQTSAFPLSLIYQLEKKRLAHFEIEISKWASRSVFVSMAEAELFKKIGGQGWIEFLSNGTDLDLRRLPLEQIPFHAIKSNGGNQPNGARLIFVGTMNYYPNIDAVRYFAQEIFPLIRQKFPEAIFEIVGRYPTKTVCRLDKIEGVRVVGEVSDVRSYLVRADVSVAPIRIARGVQNKVLEAMALGVPVVATPAAIEGIDVCNGEEVLIGTSGEEFSQHVIQLLSNTELCKTMTRKARNKMNQFYNWDFVGLKLETLLANESRHDVVPVIGDVSVGSR